MKKLNHVLISFLNAFGVFVYVTGVAWLLLNGEHIFGQVSGFVLPIFLLLLLIVSASITGLLVFGKPVHLYLGGFKKEASVLLFVTLAWLIGFLLLLVIVLLF